MDIFISFFLFNSTENTEQNSKVEIEHQSRFTETHLYPITRTDDEEKNVEQKGSEDLVSLNNPITEVPREEQGVSSPTLSLDEVAEEIMEEPEDEVAEKIKKLEVKYCEFWRTIATTISTKFRNL